MGKSWAIKLGSGGRCVKYCESRSIIGLGWRTVNLDIALSATKAELKKHITEVCPFYTTERERGGAAGQLYRFIRECDLGDYVLYYVPAKKHVVVTQIVSGPLLRDFDFDDDTDIHHYRRVELIGEPISILDLYGPLVGSILGPRMSFWDLGQHHKAIEIIASGGSPSLAAAPDPELEAAYHALRDLVLRRAESLHPEDWEWLVVDYFKAQGAHVDERRVGGNRAVVDVEAVFHHGELGAEVWHIQVKRFQNQVVGWESISAFAERVGAGARACFVSIYGFTEEARVRADQEDIHLMEAADFTRFLLSGRYRETLNKKLCLPLLGGLSGLGSNALD